MRIAIIGAGNVGKTLGRRWATAGHEVTFGVRDPNSEKSQELANSGTSVGSLAYAAAFGDVVVFATPWSATADAVRAAGDLSDKPVLDCTNPIRADFTGLEFGTDDSAGERMAAMIPGARVVKIFNTVGYNVMESPLFGDEPASMLYCGDDPSAKHIAAKLAADLGFEPVDAGPLVQSRSLEALAWLWISMAIKYGHGREIAFNLHRR